MSETKTARAKSGGFVRGERIPGLLFLVVGVGLFYLAVSFIVSFGLIAALMSAWAAAGLIFVGTVWVLGLDVRHSSISLVAVLGALLGWSLILLVPLPDDSQILLASIVSLAFVLLYLHQNKKRATGSQMGVGKGRRLAVVFGILLFVPGLVSMVSLIGVAVIFSPFIAWLISLPLFLDVLLGFQLIRGKSFKEAIIGWFTYTLPTCIPFLVVFIVDFLPTPYQILAATLTLTAVVFGFYSLRQRGRRLRSIKGMNHIGANT